MKTTRQMPADSTPIVERHPYHCPVCFKVRDHSRRVEGILEVFICRKCGNRLEFVLRRDD